MRRKEGGVIFRITKACLASAIATDFLSRFLSTCWTSTYIEQTIAWRKPEGRVRKDNHDSTARVNPQQAVLERAFDTTVSQVCFSLAADKLADAEYESIHLRLARHFRINIDFCCCCFSSRFFWAELFFPGGTEI